MKYLSGYKKFLLEGLSKEQEEEFLSDWDENRLEDWFGKNNHRLYLPLKKRVGEGEVGELLNDGRETTESKIRDYLEETYGDRYEIEDYVQGLAIDHKNKNRVLKLGKILKDQYLLKAFNEDLTRAGNKTAKKDPIVCISKHPADIALMSTGRGWKSCKELPNPDRPGGGANYHYLKEEVKVLLIAYLIYPDDKKIEHPIARVNLLPYYNKKGQIYYHAIDKSYGELGQLAGNFYDTINAWLDGHQKDLKSQAGVFRLDPKVYHDGARKEFAFGGGGVGLKSLILDAVVDGVYNIYDEGIYVDGNVDLRHQFTIENILNEIGQFIEVSGTFICNPNLKSLEGAPQEVGGFEVHDARRLTSLIGAPKICNGGFIVTGCPIKSLEGCPAIIRGDFVIVNTRIQNLVGGPRLVEDDYRVRGNDDLKSLQGMATEIGGDIILTRNALTSLKFNTIEETNGMFEASANQLTSLEGAPRRVNGAFNVRENLLKNLVGGPEFAERYNVEENRLTSLKGLGEVETEIILRDNPDLKYIGDAEVMIKTLADSLGFDSDLDPLEIYRQARLMMLRKEDDTIKLTWTTSEDISLIGDVDFNLDEDFGLDGYNENRIIDIYGRFSTITGTVTIIRKKRLSNLVGLPLKVFELNLSDCNIVSLDGCPEVIEGDFNLSDCRLGNLDGGPKLIEGDFYLLNSKNLRAVDEFPEVKRSVIAEGCHPEFIESLSRFKDKIGGKIYT